MLPIRWDSKIRLFSAPSQNHPSSALGWDDDTCARRRAAWEAQRVGMREYTSQRASKTDRLSLGRRAAVISLPLWKMKLLFSTPPGNRKSDVGKFQHCFSPKRGVETLPSFGLVMSSRDFVVLTRWTDQCR